MSDAASPAPQLVTELRVSAHMMQLDAGVYCIFYSPGSLPPDPATGLPGTRISVPPGHSAENLMITGFNDDGWLGSLDSVALVRVANGPAHVLMTIYQARESEHPAPRLQVSKVADVGVPGAQKLPPAQPAPQQVRAGAEAAAQAEVAAHLQVNGDVLGQLGEWVGEPGSQRWVEGFALSPRHPAVAAADIEYQAVLGRGWLSPWAEGGEFCGSRGMALPILGLRVRLRGKAAQTHTLEVNATFTDGTKLGPIGPGDACEADSLAPLEAFRISIVESSTQATAAKPKRAAPPAAMPAEPVKPAAAKPARGRRSA